MTSTAPVKSHHQPLHNFSLPFLKWAHKNPHHRFSSPPHFPSTSSDSDNPNLIPVGSRTRTRFPFATCSSSQKQPSPAVLDTEKVYEVAVETEESGAKPWNLRPRKNGGVLNMKNGESPETAVPAAAMKSMRLRGLGEGERAEKREKRKFWIALSKEEIEEDVYAMTGSKPARRPKKRPKNVQNQLDNVFPGLYLVGLTADSYRVHDALS